MTSTLQLQINGNTVSGSAQELVELLQKIPTVVANKPNKNNRKKATQVQQTFEQFIVQQITPELGAELAQQVVDVLEGIKNTEPDFRKFRVMYSKVETIEHRQLLKVVSATYRVKYARFQKEQYLSAIFSTIKYATICPHCGSLAAGFIVRLKQEGYFND